jgi:hypothetical protein
MSKPDFVKQLRASLNEIIKKPAANMYLLKKHPSRSPEEGLELSTVDISDEVSESLRSVAEVKLKEIVPQLEEGEFKLQGFFDLNPRPNSLFTCQFEDVEVMNYVFVQMKQRQRLRQATKINSDDIHAMAVEIPLSNGKVVYFRKYTKSKIITTRGALTISFYEGRFNRIKGDILIFDREIDCMCYENDQTIVIFDREGFEHVFNFNEYYAHQSRKALGKLTPILTGAITEPLLSEMAEKKRISKRITNLSRAGAFDALKPKLFEDHKKKLGKRVTYEIENGKILIFDQQSLLDFLDVCEDNFLEGVVTENMYRSFGKEPMAR